MNKRREHITARLEKKEHKEVKKAMGQADTVLPSKPKPLAETVKKAKHHKVSKRTSPSEKIEDSTPAHTHTENEHWARCIRSQNGLKASRLRKKLSKKQVNRGRMR